jgi:hypothetical protein
MLTLLGRPCLCHVWLTTGGVAGVGQGVVDAYERGSGGLVLRAKVGRESNCTFASLNA